jgi:uncharacterized integral membrane protein
MGAKMIVKFITNLLSYLIIAFWVGFFAIFSIQNIQAVSLKFLVLESVKLPVGVLLAFSLGVGLVLGAFTPLIWQAFKPEKKLKER